MAQTIPQLLPGIVLHECDPNGDIILHIRRPYTPFAVWDDSFELAAIEQDANHVDDEPRPAENELFSHPVVALIDDEPESAEDHLPLAIDAPIMDEPAPINDGPAPADAGDEVVSDDEAPLEDAPEPPSAEDHPSTKTDDEPPGMEIRVSSCHLILASSHFRRMLKGDWKEANSLQLNGCLRIEETDWDGDALRIVMDIIHGQFRRVPKAISLEVLAKIAVLVDYYECLEVVEVFSSNWIKSLKHTIPATYSRNTILWMWISWVFHQPDLFRSTTIITTKNCRGAVQTIGLPIPDQIIRR
jgi:hypothetical protein